MFGGDFSRRRDDVKGLDFGAGTIFDAAQGGHELETVGWRGEFDQFLEGGGEVFLDAVGREVSSGIEFVVGKEVEAASVDCEVKAQSVFSLSGQPFLDVFFEVGVVWHASLEHAVHKVGAFDFCFGVHCFFVVKRKFRLVRRGRSVPALALAQAILSWQGSIRGFC